MRSKGTEEQGNGGACRQDALVQKILSICLDFGFRHITAKVRGEWGVQTNGCSREEVVGVLTNGWSREYHLSGLPLRLPAIDSPSSARTISYCPNLSHSIKTVLAVCDQCECACHHATGKL